MHAKHRESAFGVLESYFIGNSRTNDEDNAITSPSHLCHLVTLACSHSGILVPRLGPGNDKAQDRAHDIHCLTEHGNPIRTTVSPSGWRNQISVRGGASGHAQIPEPSLMKPILSSSTVYSDCPQGIRDRM